jgi:hypothetical protein
VLYAIVKTFHILLGEKLIKDIFSKDWNIVSSEGLVLTTQIARYHNRKDHDASLWIIKAVEREKNIKLMDTATRDAEIHVSNKMSEAAWYWTYPKIYTGSISLRSEWNMRITDGPQEREIRQGDK